MLIFAVVMRLLFVKLLIGFKKAYLKGFLSFMTRQLAETNEQVWWWHKQTIPMTYNYK